MRAIDVSFDELLNFLEAYKLDTLGDDESCDLTSSPHTGDIDRY